MSPLKAGTGPRRSVTPPNSKPIPLRNLYRGRSSTSHVAACWRNSAAVIAMRVCVRKPRHLSIKLRDLASIMRRVSWKSFIFSRPREKKRTHEAKRYGGDEGMDDAVRGISAGDARFRRHHGRESQYTDHVEVAR